MAQRVGYWDDNVEFTEGPFVVVGIHGYRIECELKGHHCPVIPDCTIYTFMERLGWKGKTLDVDLAERVCDGLNALVREGAIVLSEKGSWIRAGTSGEKSWFG